MADELISRQTAESALDEIIKAYIAEKSYTGNFAAGVACDIRDNVIAELPSVNAVVLPCKVGDTVYRLLWSQGGKKRWNFHIAEQRVKNLHDIVDCIEGLNKTVFLTREEAEKALEGREDDA